ncbi:FAD binding domain-containing protein, partial [Polaromonas sp.]|uniref:xanthine dehydrogenase small subunit n=1 Tax=Polaromonas sp. TaxID=1869339 RepID=UPI002B629417
MSVETAPEPVAALAVSPIRFVRRGEIVSLSNVPPSRTLLDLLRDDLACTGTKEGCGEGDCGACTVVLGEEDNGALRFRAVNSCIRLAHSIDGLALWTVEDLAAPDGTLHPAQQAMVQAHASQCGFCTPGFVMSLFAMYQNHITPTLVTACTSLPPEVALRLRPGPSTSSGQAKAGSPAPAGEEGAANPISRATAVEELSGNLCRCTGYRPILDAAQGMAALPRVPLDEAHLLSKLELLAQERRGLQAYFAYKSPRYLRELLKLRAAHPEAQLVAGCTDVGLWVTRQHQQFDHVIDVSKVRELRRIHDTPEMLAIGAAVTLADAFAALVRQWPQLHSFAARFAGLPVRNSGTLGGNVANGSPIGDSMPLLIALGARVVLMTQRGSREMPIEQLYTGYRQNVIAPDEVLAWIKVPTPGSPHPHPLPEGEG